MDLATDVSLARLRMVEEQIPRHGVHDARVLAAMVRIPREAFVELADPVDAYADRAWPIACEQTISQPAIVALMTEALQLRGGESVLEVGTGSGYQTAVLAELVRRVISIEQHSELSQRAARVLEQLGYTNVELLVGDGTRGCPAEAPFDRILVAAATEQVPQALLDQLAEGGRLVIPLGGTERQVLTCLQRYGHRTRSVEITPCRFVPLVNQAVDQDG